MADEPPNRGGSGDRRDGAAPSPKRVVGGPGPPRQPWANVRGTPEKQEVPPQVGGTVDPPSHPPESRWWTVVDHSLTTGLVVLPLLMVVVGGAVIVVNVLGGAIVAVAATIVVVSAGVWLMRLGVSAELVRAVQDSATERGRPRRADDDIRRIARFEQRLLGAAVVAGGAVGLTFAFAAL
jgi:hypothetical protein